jgi:hypothetical protein
VSASADNYKPSLSYVWYVNGELQVGVTWSSFIFAGDIGIYNFRVVLTDAEGDTGEATASTVVSSSGGGGGGGGCGGMLRAQPLIGKTPEGQGFTIVQTPRANTVACDSL